MTIHRVTISNFMGIEALELKLSPEGVWIEGGNAKGKTSVLKAMRAALAGQGISDGAIRKGATAAEIVVNLDDLTIRRIIDRNGTSLRVSGPPDGRARPAPKELLAALLGASPIDPLEIFLAKPKERRALILAAFPMAVTAEQLAAWSPPGADLTAILGARGDGTPDTSGHGLEVVGRVHDAFYAQRTGANATRKLRRKDAEQAQATRERLCAELAAAKEAAPSAGIAVPDAEEALRTARGKRVELDALNRAADRAALAREGTTFRIAKLRGEASKVRAEAPLAPPESVVEHEAEIREGLAAVIEANRIKVESLRRELAEWEKALAASEDDLRVARLREKAMDEQEAAAHAALDRLIDLEQQALDLEAAIGEEPARASAEQLSASDDAIVEAARVLEAARRAETARAELEAKAAETDRAVIAASEAERLAAEADARAAELDAAVKALAKDAPAALLAASDGIPGLSLEGETVLIDGVDLERLSGAEQMRFAVRVSLNPQRDAKDKYLVIDGLERLDPEQRKLFAEWSLAGGAQVFATQVTDGDMRVRPFHEMTAAGSFAAELAKVKGELPDGAAS